MENTIIVFVKAKTFHSGEFKYGILLPKGNDGFHRLQFIYFNYVINRLDWIVDIIHNDSIQLVKKVCGKQRLLF